MSLFLGTIYSMYKVTVLTLTMVHNVRDNSIVQKRRDTHVIMSLIKKRSHLVVGVVVMYFDVKRVVV